MFPTVAAGWLNEQHKPEMFTLQARVTCFWDDANTHNILHIASDLWPKRVSAYIHVSGATPVDQQSLHSTLSSREESPPIALNAPVSEGNASSFGLLHSADSIVHIMANWFYGSLQFAETDKNGFPRLFLFRSPLSLCHSNWMTPLTML